MSRLWRARSWIGPSWASALVVHPQVTWAQTLAQGQAPLVNGRWVGALALCLALALAAAFVLRWRLAKRDGSVGLGAGVLSKLVAFDLFSPVREPRLTVIQTVTATPTLHISLLELDGEEYLIAAGNGAIILLKGPAPGSGRTE